jgi:hypothetical protein
MIEFIKKNLNNTLKLNDNKLLEKIRIFDYKITIIASVVFASSLVPAFGLSFAVHPIASIGVISINCIGLGILSHRLAGFFKKPEQAIAFMLPIPVQKAFEAQQQLDKATAAVDKIDSLRNSIVLVEAPDIIAGFNQLDVMKMVNACQLSYGSPESKARYDASYDITEIETKSEGRCVIIEKDSDVIIAFRGTKKKENLLTNIMVWYGKNSTISGYMHSGFNKLYQELDAPIKKKLETLKDKNIRINITGHSLGGALATLCAFHLKKRFSNLNIRVLTVASPRVLDHAAANEYDQLLGEGTLRISQYRRDPVTAIPVGSTGYKHVGQHLRIKTHPNHSPHGLMGYQKVLESLPKSDFISNNTPSYFAFISTSLGVALAKMAKKVNF